MRAIALALPLAGALFSVTPAAAVTMNYTFYGQFHITTATQEYVDTYGELIGTGNSDDAVDLYGDGSTTVLELSSLKFVIGGDTYTFAGNYHYFYNTAYNDLGFTGSWADSWPVMMADSEDVSLYDGIQPFSLIGYSPLAWEQQTDKGLLTLNPQEQDYEPFLRFKAEEAALAPPAAVPEVATWAMMVAGFGLAGTALRRRQTVSFA